MPQIEPRTNFTAQNASICGRQSKLLKFSYAISTVISRTQLKVSVAEPILYACTYAGTIR
jgi:hypothetical protein